MCRQTRLRSRNRRKKPAFGNFPLFIKITRLPACQPLRFKLHCTTNRCGSTAQAKLAKVKNRIEKHGRSPNSIRNRPFCRKRPVFTRGKRICGRLKKQKKPSESVASAQPKTVFRRPLPLCSNCVSPPRRAGCVALPRTRFGLLGEPHRFVAPIKRACVASGRHACLKYGKRPSESVASVQLRFQTASVFPKNVQRFSSTSSTNLLPA